MNIIVKMKDNRKVLKNNRRKILKVITKQNVQILFETKRDVK